MNVFLLHPDRDFDFRHALPWNEKELVQDLELNILFEAMGSKDDFILEVIRKTIMLGLTNENETILHRQGILNDCLENHSVINLLYTISMEAEEAKRESWFGFYRHAATIQSSSLRLMEDFVTLFQRLRNIADENTDRFHSTGFTRFFKMIQNELTEDYFQEIRDHLRDLRLEDGTLISATLGNGNKGINYKLCRWQAEKQNWWCRLFPRKPKVYTFDLHPRDESGARALSELKDEGINHVANALAQSSDHVIRFFEVLRSELAFYLGCINLHTRLTEINGQVCYPVPVASKEPQLKFTGLYDACLALKMRQQIVGSNLKSDGKNLIVITGANQGGKSTFLRGTGVAQLMMQAGMFIGAENFSGNTCNSLFTHFKREEDSTMKSGKFDEELNRMSQITDHITSRSVILFNESFAATNEREGSEIAGQIVRALIEKNVKVLFVTHLYEFAHDFYNRKLSNAIFLQAERKADATRTFKMIEGEPSQTSFGADIYKAVFTPVSDEIKIANNAN